MVDRWATVLGRWRAASQAATHPSTLPMFMTVVWLGWIGASAGRRLLHQSSVAHWYTMYDEYKTCGYVPGYSVVGLLIQPPRPRIHSSDLSALIISFFASSIHRRWPLFILLHLTDSILDNVHPTSHHSSWPYAYCQSNQWDSDTANRLTRGSRHTRPTCSPAPSSSSSGPLWPLPLLWHADQTAISVTGLRSPSCRSTAVVSPLTTEQHHVSAQPHRC